MVKIIAEKTHGATPRWLYVVSDRSMLDPCGVMAIEYESQNMSHSALEKSSMYLWYLCIHLEGGVTHIR